MATEDHPTTGAPSQRRAGPGNALMRRRWPLALALGLLGPLALFCALLLPGVQRRVVKLMFPSGPNASLEFGDLRVGLRGARARDLHLNWHGLKLDVGEAEARFGLFGLITSKTARLDRLRVTGLVVDVRSVERAATDLEQGADEPFRFEGLRPLAGLPVRIIVSEIAVDAEFLSTTPTGRTARLHAVLSGRDIAPGATGSLNAEVGLRLESGDAVRDILVGTGSLSVHEDDSGLFDRLEFHGEVHPASPDALPGTGLSATASTDLTVPDESYRLVLSTTGTTAREVVGVVAARKASDGRVAGSWTAHLDAGQATPYFGDLVLPDFALNGNGTFDVDPVALAAATQSHFEASASQWDRLDPELAAIGALRIEADIRADVAFPRVDVHSLSARLAPLGLPHVLEIAADQPFRLDTKARTFEPSRWGAPLVHLRLAGLPITWWGGSGKGVKPLAGALQGALEMTADDPQRIRVRSTEPLTLAGARLHTALRDVGPISVRADVDATMGPDAISATLAGCRAEFAGGGHLDFDGSFAMPKDGRLIATLNGDLATHFVWLSRMIPEIDALQARGTFGLDIPAGTLSLVDAEVVVAGRDGRKLVDGSISTVRPLVVDLHDFAPRWNEFEPETLALRVDGFPVAWVSRYLPQIRIASGTLHGDFRATIPPDRSVRIAGEVPFEVRDLDLYWGDLAVLTGARLEVTPSIVLSKDSIEAELKPVAFRDARGNRFNGTVRVETTPDHAADATFRVDLRAFAPTLTNRVGNLGDFEIRADGSFDSANNALKLGSASFDCKDQEGRSYLSGTSLQPFTVGLAKFQVAPSGASNDLFRATFTPLEIERIFPEALGFTLAGPLPSGEAFISASDGGLLFHAPRPLAFGPVTVNRNGVPFLDRVDFTFLPEVAYTTTGVRSRKTRLEISSAGKSIATIESRGVFDVLGHSPERTIETTIEAALPGLFEQPVGKGLPGFDRGTFAASWRLALGDLQSADFRLELSDVARSDGRVAPDFELLAHLKEEEKSSFRFDAPIRLKAPGRTSDLTARGQLRIEQSENTLEMSLDSDRLVWEDMAQLAAAFLPPDAAAASPNPSADRLASRGPTLMSRFGSTDRRPLWDRLHGRIPIRLRSVEFDRYALENAHATIESTHDELAIEDIGATFLGARMVGRAAIAFDGGGAAPVYGVDARFGVLDVDLGKMFTSVDPSRKPTLEGRFRLEGGVTGSGPDPVVALFESHGEILAEGKDGVFRGLVPSAKSASLLVRAAGALTFSKELRATGRLIGQLQEIKVSEARVRLERDPSRGLVLDSLDVVSGDLVVHGSGSLRRERGVPLVDRDLQLEVGLAASGDAAIVFDGLGLLGDQAGETGHRTVTQVFSVGGTVAAPDASDLWETLDEAAAQAKGSFGWALRKAMKQASKYRVTQPTPVDPPPGGADASR